MAGNPHTKPPYPTTPKTVKGHKYFRVMWSTDDGPRLERIYGTWDNPDTEHFLADWHKVKKNGGLWPCGCGVGTVGGLIHHFKKDSASIINTASRAEADIWRAAINELKTRHQSVKANEFSPEMLRTLQRELGARVVQTTGLRMARTTVNKYVKRIQGLFAYGRDVGLVKRDVYYSLLEVQPVKKGSTLARTPEKIKPMRLDQYRAAIAWTYSKPRVKQKRQLRAMIRFHRLTGARPGEIVILRQCDIRPVKGTDYFLWTPYQHKTRHHGQTREIQILKRAMRVIKPFLEAVKPSEHVFTYDVHNYGRAVRYACRKMGVDQFTPNQLRHWGVTNDYNKHGLEVAADRAGHSTTRTTEEVYVEKNRKRSFDIAAAG